ncbi:m7GpppX diphosphatase-like isoform X2 [Ptychodera flava]
MADDNTSMPAAKKAKCESGDVQEARKDFTGFVVDKVLNEVVQSKAIFVQGHFKGSDEPAVVILEKTAFDRDTLGDMLSSRMELQRIMQNDIYDVYNGYPPQNLNGISTRIIYPATERHIMKYTSQQVYLIEETAADYQNITLPSITSRAFSIQWVYNILDKKAEADRILYEDEDPEIGYLLAPDMKWDQTQIDNLHIDAICHKRNIKSIRDLTEGHLPLLQNIKEKGTEFICEKYGLTKNHLRVFLHYQPSYYHLHVHFTHINFDAPGSRVGQAHLLSDVIDNIQLQHDYYQKKTMTFTVREKDPLFQKFREAGKV